MKTIWAFILGVVMALVLGGAMTISSQDAKEFPHHYSWFGEYETGLTNGDYQAVVAQREIAYQLTRIANALEKSNKIQDSIDTHPSDIDRVLDVRMK